MVVLYIHYDLVLNNNIWKNKIISFEYILLCDVLFSLSAKKMKIKKKQDRKRKRKKIVLSKIMFDNNL
jgi:hypothetical protein